MYTLTSSWCTWGTHGHQSFAQLPKAACRSSCTSLHACRLIRGVTCLLPDTCRLVYSPSGVVWHALLILNPLTTSSQQPPHSALLPSCSRPAQDIPGIEAGSIVYRIDSLLFFLPKSLKNKVKQNILRGQERALRKAKALRMDKHAGQGSKATAGVRRLRLRRMPVHGGIYLHSLQGIVAPCQSWTWPPQWGHVGVQGFWPRGVSGVSVSKLAPAAHQLQRKRGSAAGLDLSCTLQAPPPAFA